MRSRRDHSRRQDGDAGAVAILTALLAIVLFGFAAVAVELGDMYSRDSAVQTTADLAAFAGAQDLPNACNAFASAAARLADPENGVSSDTDPTTFSATTSQLSDGVTTNGEIEILDWDGHPLPVGAPCSDAGHQVKVVTPQRTIKFPLTGGLPSAPDSATVQGGASVELRSLKQLSVLPFSIPDTCPKGSQVIYGRDGIPSPPAGTPAFDPPGRRSGPYVDAVFPDSAQVPVPETEIQVRLSRLRADPELPGPAVQFDFHLLRPDGTTIRRPPLPDAVDGVLVPGSSVANGTRFDATFTVALPPDVQTIAGLWRIRGRQPGPGDRYTRNSRVGTFTVQPAVPPTCAPTDGVYGLLASPRAVADGPAISRAKNFIQGIDHDLFPVAKTTIDKPCDFDGVPYADARLDDVSPTTGATCVDVQPDLSAASPTDGLINGVGSLDGRLVGIPSVTTSGDCRVANDPLLRWTKNGHTLVDTALSCYLSPSKGLTDVKNGVKGSLTTAILSDPRFFVIPTTDTRFHPSNASGPGSGPQYWPIKNFRGVFLTNETTAGGDASCDNDDDCNGLVFGGGGQLDSVRVFTFPLSALSGTATHPDNGRPFIGGPSDLLLVR